MSDEVAVEEEEEEEEVVSAPAEAVAVAPVAPLDSPVEVAVEESAEPVVAGMTVEGSVVEAEVPLVDVAVEVAEAVEATELVLGFWLWSDFIAQFPSALQEKPNGQHLDPQVSSVPVSALVMTTLSGCWLLSSSEMSQGMGSISLQSEPVGQQSAVVFPAKAIQL